MGWSVDPIVWGKGVATEAARAVLEAYWKTFPGGFPGLQGDERDYVCAHIRPDNRASVGLAKKLGFEFWKEDEEERDGGRVRLLVHVYRLWRPGKVGKKGGGRVTAVVE